MCKLDSKRRAHKIDRGTYILDSSGVSPEGKYMKLQADHSSRVVNELFDSGALRLIPSTDNDQSSPQEKQTWSYTYL